MSCSARVDLQCAGSSNMWPVGLAAASCHRLQAADGIAPFLGFVSYFARRGETFRAPQNVHFWGWYPCHVSYKSLVNVRFRPDEPPVSYLWGRDSHEFETQLIMGNPLSNCGEKPHESPCIPAAPRDYAATSLSDCISAAPSDYAGFWVLVFGLRFDDHDFFPKGGKV